MAEEQGEEKPRPTTDQKPVTVTTVNPTRPTPTGIDLITSGRKPDRTTHIDTKETVSPKEREKE